MRKLELLCYFSLLPICNKQFSNDSIIKHFDNYYYNYSTFCCLFTDGFEGKLAFCERKWYKLGTNVRDIIYSVCAGAGLFMYLTILHADKHTLVLLTWFEYFSGFDRNKCKTDWPGINGVFSVSASARLSLSQPMCLTPIFGMVSCMFFLCSNFNKDHN